MEKFYLELPSIERKDEVIEYINEFYECNSQIHGTGGVDRAIKRGESYETWLANNLQMSNSDFAKSKGLVPSNTFFLIREEDNRLVGMIDLRYELNDYLRNIGGHIGYSVRPSERKKGYNKINIYLCLIEAQKHGLDKVLITCADYNEGSRNSIKAFDGIFEKETYDESDNENMELYWIDVNTAIDKYKNIYDDKCKKVR